MRLKVLVIAPDPRDGTAWWRVVSPLGMLGETFRGEFEWRATSEADHAEVTSCDLLVLQRPIRPQDTAYMAWAKRLGIPVVVDYDDDYTDIPPNNPRMLGYMQPDVQARIGGFLTGADLLTVSTLELKRRWRGHNQRIAVVPNAWDDRMQLNRGGERLPTTGVLWRGGDAHNHDLELFGDAILRAAWEGGPALWHFVGHSIYQIHARMPPASITEYPFSDVLTYFDLLGQIRPNIMIVPLADTPFNRAKSNIALLEGAFAGAVVLAPDWPSWQAPGVVNYKGPGDFSLKLASLTRLSRERLAAQAAETWTAVRDNMLVSRANVLRATIYAKLAEEFRARRTLPTGYTEDKLPEILGLKEKRNGSSEETQGIGDSSRTPLESESGEHSSPGA